MDQQRGISEPIGMTGSRLEAEVYLVTVLSSVLAEPAEVRRSGPATTWREFVLEPLAASLAVLTPDERELGCAIVELGGGSTNVAIFQDGKIRHTGSLLCAGGHVTNDIVHGLQVTQQDAERLKERSGAAWEPLVPECRHHRAAGHAGPGRPDGAPPGARAHHAHAAAGDAGVRARRDHPGRVPPAASRRCRPDRRRRAQAPGIVELAREVFAMPVRVGMPGQGLARPRRQRGVAPDGGAGRARCSTARGRCVQGAASGPATRRSPRSGEVS